MHIFFSFDTVTISCFVYYTCMFHLFSYLYANLIDNVDVV